MCVIKVNCDASLVQKLGSCGVGGILLDGNGSLVGGFGQSILCQLPEVAETMGIIEGHRAAIEMSIDKVVLETDSEIVFKVLRMKTDVISWQLPPALDEVKSLMHLFSDMKLSLVRRSTNRKADV